jgi:LAS superfamily LD-carboxypeptidase LdcB
MAGSRCKDPFGADLDLQGMFPPRTPGPLGHLDAADPGATALPGDTPGPLGVADYADPAAAFLLIPPLNFQANPAFLAFEAAVLGSHLKRASHNSKKHRAGNIPASELEVVEDGRKLRKPFAATCRKLLKEARADLAAEKATFHKKTKNEREAEKQAFGKGGRTPAVEVKSIGISSAYRSIEYDSALWHSYFEQKFYPQLYAQLRHLSCWDGGEYGGNAVRLMVDQISPQKAAPGYSNHSRGIAVDFFTVEAGVLVEAKVGKNLSRVNQRWEKTWLYRWLEAHKAEYKIERISTEAWHWEFQTK